MPQKMLDWILLLIKKFSGGSKDTSDMKWDGPFQEGQFNCGIPWLKNQILAQSRSAKLQEKVFFKSN